MHGIGEGDGRGGIPSRCGETDIAAKPLSSRGEHT